MHAIFPLFPVIEEDERTWHIDVRKGGKSNALGKEIFPTDWLRRTRIVAANHHCSDHVGIESSIGKSGIFKVFFEILNAIPNFKKYI